MKPLAIARVDALEHVRERLPYMLERGFAAVNLRESRESTPHASGLDGDVADIAFFNK